MRQHTAVLAILIAVVAIMLVSFPLMVSLAHVTHKWPSIPICKNKNATKHETEGNVSRHINNCA